MTRTPLVHDTIGIVIQDLLLEGVQRLVELEPGVTGSESRHKDVGFGAFDGIVVDAGVDGFQDIVGTETERTDIQGGIGNEVEQLGWVLDGDSGGFVDSFAKFAPESSISCSNWARSTGRVSSVTMSVIVLM